MIHNDIPQPEISSDFTIDDIHKIRLWHYERLKDATHEEIISFYNIGAVAVFIEMGTLQGGTMKGKNTRKKNR
jgi:hypothetical protein